MLDLGEGLLDWVEVGRVWRQEPEPCACGFDDFAKDNGLVAAEIVQDDDVARPQGRYELLLDISAEGLAVDRPVEDTRGGKPVATQRTKEGQRAPMAVWRKGAQAFAFVPPAAQRGHVGLDPGLVDEDELGWVEMTLPRPPSLTPPRDVATRLLKREQRFF